VDFHLEYRQPVEPRCRHGCWAPRKRPHTHTVTYTDSHWPSK